jgi:gamma-glutamyl:cysteine ligase YbdK (ATP-grasp superfamily)
MIVSSNSLDVRPIADQLLRDDDGKFHSEVAHGEISWSNELVLHVIELKTTHPAKSLERVAEKFQQHIRSANHLLEPWDSRLMPTAMHPWMNPHREMKLWPHDYSAVYQAFDKLFDCRGHGWANLQSVHLNLPFADEEEFGQLHAAVRLLLPLLPALAASSPVIDGRITGLCDQRLEVYRHNARSIPQVSGQVVPEPVFTYGDYQQRILEPLYKAIRPYDREGILQHEWLNARGAIARFDRQTIEIRVLDVQECPAADLALLQIIIGVLRDLVAGTWSTYQDQQQFGTEPLAELLQDVIRSGDEALISNQDYLRVMGWKGDAPVTARELWRHLVYQGDLAKEIAAADAVARVLDVIFTQGPLSRRIVSALIQSPGKDTLKRVYQRLCDCLESGSMFTV